MGEPTFRYHVINNNDDKTVVFFTGFRTDNNQRLDWWSYRGIGNNVIFIEDLTKSWYHGCLDHVDSFLRNHITPRAIFIGASAGGYAALVFASRLHGRSVSINPQTTLIDDFAPVKNKSWGERYRQISDITTHGKYLDLNWIRGKHHHLYYSVNNELDRFNAERMVVSLHPINHHKHGLAEWLQNNDNLPKIVKERVDET